MNSEQSLSTGAPEAPRTPEILGTAASVPATPGPDVSAGEAAAGLEAGSLPVMPGFREMASRKLADDQAARMAEDRARLLRELAGERQAAGLSQTEIAARMGTSQSAVARLESGTADVRASTLERYAAAVGGQITWTLHRPEPPDRLEEGEGS